MFSNHEPSQSGLATMDAELAEFIESMDLSQTAVVVAGDHGINYGTHRHTAYGSLAANNPFLVHPT